MKKLIIGIILLYSFISCSFSKEVSYDNEARLAVLDCMGNSILVVEDVDIIYLSSGSVSVEYYDIRKEKTIVLQNMQVIIEYK